MPLVPLYERGTCPQTWLRFEPLKNWVRQQIRSWTRDYHLRGHELGSHSRIDDAVYLFAKVEHMKASLLVAYFACFKQLLATSLKRISSTVNAFCRTLGINDVRASAVALKTFELPACFDLRHFLLCWEGSGTFCYSYVFTLGGIYFCEFRGALLAFQWINGNEELSIGTPRMSQ